MLTKKQVSWKNEVNAKAWCALKGYRYLDIGAWDVYYVKPEQEGKQHRALMGEEMIDDYSSTNWLDVFAELHAAKHRFRSDLKRAGSKSKHSSNPAVPTRRR